MNPESSARIQCERPLDSKFVDRIEAALSDPAINSLLIEFQCRPETESLEAAQFAAEDPLFAHLRTLLRKMEQGPKPAIALLSGLIGGLQLEIALACDVRFAGVQTISLDFPWLKYGLMPILGGTQRLPRICGIELAAQLLLRTEKMDVLAGNGPGLFEFKEEISPETAMEWAQTHQKPGQPWDWPGQELASTYSQTPLNRQLLQRIYLNLRHRFSSEEAAPTAILRCLQEGLERSLDAGIRLEREEWSAVRRSPSTANRIKTLHVARQKALHTVVTRGVPIKRIGVLGAGLMGTGIAYAAARSGYEVSLVESSPDASERSLQRMKKMAQQETKSGLLKGEDPALLLSRIRWSSEIALLAPCDFIVEAIFERADLKKTKLAELEAVADSRATIASNTTTFPISDLATACHRPERFLGTHFFAPVDRMELLEIVVGEKTAPETIDRALSLAGALKKTPIVVRDGPGFFTSRVVAAYLQEAIFMLREGISPWMIDNVARNAGMILGPLSVIDLMGLDLLADIFESLAIHRRGAARDAQESVKILKEYIDQSRLGKKSGSGIYEYNADQQRVVSTAFGDPFSQASRQPEPNEIEERLFIVQTTEALHAIREGIIDDAAMADLASVLGWSYPAGRGGVMSFVGVMGPDKFERRRELLQDKWGDRYSLPG
jgi:3-hydroxyacyl-CoA dehydrogenase/enoyl-CoA hydratase/3-hydroxybutyryl-CoA epimerase